VIAVNVSIMGVFNYSAAMPVNGARQMPNDGLRGYAGALFVMVRI
jgi:hypothetical protein